MAEKSLLLITGSRDEVVPADDHEKPLVEALEQAGAWDFTEIVIDGANHGFSDWRIDLTRSILGWLAGQSRS